MKKEKISKDVPESKTPNVPSNISVYFTEEIRAQMNNMGLKEMESVLKEFINTQAWIALLKYISLRTPVLDATLRSVDPYKDAYKIAWAHGALAGLSDIETYVIELNSKPQEDKGDNGVLMGKN